MLIKIENDCISYHNISIRMVDYLISDINFIILASQYSIVGLDKETLEEKFCLVLKEQINAIAVNKKILYIANGKNISGFKLSRFLNK